MPGGRGAARNFLGAAAQLRIFRRSKENKWVPINESGQIIATSAEVTPNGGVVRESFQNLFNSGLGIIVICPESLGLAFLYVSPKAVGGGFKITEMKLQGSSQMFCSFTIPWNDICV